VGLVFTVAFWFIYKSIDKEEYTLTTNGDYHLKVAGEHGDAGSASAGESFSDNKVDREAALDQSGKPREISEKAAEA